jgi:hypothetical protein
MDNGVERRSAPPNQKNPFLISSQSKPDIYRALADSPRPEKKTVRDMSLEWITDANSGAETAYGVGGFRYRIYTTDEFGTVCMYMWPGHFITTNYASHEEGKQAMNDHYEALCHIREESVRELSRENDALKKRVQALTARATQP